MSPTVDPDAKSPKASEDKVQDGRIQKPKTKKKDGLIPNYRIDGRTFACEGCKNGHRVSKCTHAAQRPVLMTNDPGRPSADQKRHCDCPKKCSCTKKNCKCDRNCNCIQTMYMLVYIPVEEREDDKELEKGQWKIDYEVITDLKGKALSEEEIEIRRQEKSRQQQGRTSRASTLGAVNDRPPSQGSTTNCATPVSIKTEPPATIAASTPKSSCCHRKNILDQLPTPEVKNENVAPERAKRPLCSCGPDCKCQFCLEHPNNEASQRIAHQRATEYFGSVPRLQGNALDQKCLTLPGEKGFSCMGTKPQFAFHTNPHPSEADFQTMFGQDATTSRGYCLSYEVGGYSSGLAAPVGSCSSSSMLNSQLDSSSHTGSSQFLPFLDTNLDFGVAPGFTPQQIASQPEFSPSLNLGSATLQPDHYVGQATIAGVYGMDDDGDWAAFGASQPMPQLWRSASSDFEPTYNTSIVAHDLLKIDAALSPPPALPGLVSHFNELSAAINHPSKPQTIRRGPGPHFQAQNQYHLLRPNHTYNANQTPPATAALSTYTPDLFDLPALGDDFLTDMPASNHAYSSPDIGLAQTNPT